MESKIRVLSDQDINQIAAGEVVENAASVVKELVENALDAGATDIRVEIVGGGRQLIRVRDNGCGMRATMPCFVWSDTPPPKFDRQMTFTLSPRWDFAGKPFLQLPISKFTLMTAPTGERGTLVLVGEGGKIVKSAPVDFEKGTQVEIKELFFNVPARRKFQKAPAHDVQEILKSLALLALGHPSVAFELISNQKTVLKARAVDSLKERISEILGSEFMLELSSIQAQHQEWGLEGFIGLPSCTRQNRTGQFLFINKRAVTSPLISYAIRDGYGPALAQNRHPLFVLHLNLPGYLVDVNVHPQKREVRLRQEQALREWMVKAVEKAMPEASGFSYFATPLAPLAVAEAPPKKFEWTPQVPRPAVETQTLFHQEIAPKKIVKVLTTFPGYIAIERPGNDGFSLIDQRAAHARVIYERLMEKESVAVQALLLPYTLEFSLQESAQMAQHLETLNSCGISIKPFGGHSFVIDALPQVFGNIDVATFLRDLLADLTVETELNRQVAEKLVSCIAVDALLSMKRKG